MKTLLLLRHAKSSWKDSAISDHERPLNDRGRRACKLIRGFLDSRQMNPDFVLSSSAVRTRETVERVFANVQKAPGIRYTDDLYLATTRKLQDAVEDLENQYQRVLLVAHNPGIESLFFRLTGIEQRFPTAALAHLSFAIANWSDVADSQAKVEWFVTPKQLEDG
jgi:phosphohistidine phosphatase